MFTSAILLTVVSSLVLISGVYTARTAITHELQILASTISANSHKPIILGNYKEIDSLLAGLIYQDNIRAAYFFDGTGAPVSQHLAQRDSQFVLQSLTKDFDPANNHFWHDSTTEQFIISFAHISLFAPVFYQDERIGTLYLLSDLNSLYSYLGNVAYIIILSLLIMTCLAWFLAGWLQKPISVPLLKLATLMETISHNKDYSYRAVKVNNDEIGILVDGFNQVLEQVELHQASLAEHQLHLEHKVVERTAELRTAVASLQVARQQADNANQAKSHFLSRMTHELRTPLIGVLGMNELLTRTKLSEQQRELVATVDKSGNQLLQLIVDVLDFSRIEAGKLVLDIGEFDLSLMVQEVITLLSVQAQQKHLLLSLNLSIADSLIVCGDEVRIRQILMNLIGNAIKFTTIGAVAVSVSSIEKSSSTRTFIFEIEDTGSGMSVGDQEHIFEVFYQTEGGMSAGGAGLGLAIVKQLIDLMGGELEVVTTIGHGSRFRVFFDLPLVDGR